MTIELASISALGAATFQVTLLTGDGQTHTSPWQVQTTEDGCISSIRPPDCLKDIIWPDPRTIRPVFDAVQAFWRAHSHDGLSANTPGRSGSATGSHSLLVPEDQPHRPAATYTLAWGHDSGDPSGQNTVHISAAGEAGAVLDTLGRVFAAQKCPHLMDIYQGTWAKGQPVPPHGFQLVWGHPQRVALTWLGDGPGHAVDPSLPEWPEPIGYDHGEKDPHHTRLTPAQARQAICEYVRTLGRRPTCVPCREP